MLDSEFVLTVLRLFGETDSHSLLWWRTDDEYAPLQFFVNCNDVFHWGTADLEEITPDDVPALRSAIASVQAVTGTTGWSTPSYWTALYVARRRKMRPQGRAYPHDKRLWLLFDAAGPQRSLDEYGNTPRSDQELPHMARAAVGGLRVRVQKFLSRLK